MASEGSGGPIRRRVVFSGRVQGVFFRATSAELSRGYRVVGYVRNLPDGTVELQAEGPPEQVEAFLASVSRHFQNHITQMQTDELAVRGDESAFGVRY